MKAQNHNNTSPTTTKTENRVHSATPNDTENNDDDRPPTTDHRPPPPTMPMTTTQQHTSINNHDDNHTNHHRNPLPTRPGAHSQSVTPTAHSLSLTQCYAHSLTHSLCETTHPHPPSLTVAVAALLAYHRPSHCEADF